MLPRRASTILLTSTHSDYFSEHADFSESTEEIAPLTQDEKTAKLDELRERLKAKRAVQADKDKEEHKRNEVPTLLLIYQQF